MVSSALLCCTIESQCRVNVPELCVNELRIMEKTASCTCTYEGNRVEKVNRVNVKASMLMPDECYQCLLY